MAFTKNNLFPPEKQNHNNIERKTTRENNRHSSPFSTFRAPWFFSSSTFSKNLLFLLIWYSPLISLVVKKNPEKKTKTSKTSSSYAPPSSYIAKLLNRENTRFQKKPLENFCEKNSVKKILHFYERLAMTINFLQKIPTTAMIIFGYNLLFFQ